MYKTIQVELIDTGPGNSTDLAMLHENLDAEVSAACMDGWQPIGGPLVIQRQRPHGVQLLLIQAIIPIKKFVPECSDIDTLKTTQQTSTSEKFPDADAEMLKVSKRKKD